MNKSQITLQQAKSAVIKCVKAGVAPFLHSSPGIGKSSLYHQIAKEHNLKVIDWRGAGADPTDLNGFPALDGAFAVYKPFETFPTTNTKIPEGYQGWLIIMDELTSAPRSVQAACYKLILDRQVGNHDIHPSVSIVAAGNLDTDGAITQPISTALVNRMAQFYIRIDNDAWLDWAVKNDIDPMKIAFINFKPDCLYTFNPDAPKNQYASPRTWEMLDKIEKQSGHSTSEDLPLVASLIGEGTAVEYLAFIKIAAEAPSIKKIMANPSTEPVPTRQDLRYALSGSLAQAMSVDNCAALSTYIERMPDEFQLLTVRTAYARNQALLDSDSFKKLLDRFISYIEQSS